MIYELDLFFLNTYIRLFPDDEETKLTELINNDQKTVTENSEIQSIEKAEDTSNSAQDVKTNSDKQSHGVLKSPTQSENTTDDIKSDAKPPEKRTDNETSQQDKPQRV